jgi:hypothetical protein
MATDPQVINDGSEDITYNLVSLTGSEAIYRDAASSLSEPNTIRISHQLSNKQHGVDRHLVAFARTANDDDDLETPYTGSVHVVISAPRDAVSLADLSKEWTKLATFIDTNLDEIYGGFMP